MRYEKGHKDATRQHILDVASAQFREGGVAAVGIAGIMTDAGLTNGAFYNHFESKEDLVEAVLAYALGGRRVGLRANLEAGKPLHATIRDYLSARHRDDARMEGGGVAATPPPPVRSPRPAPPTGPPWPPSLPARPGAGG